jgi:hypothetical protein
MDGKFTQDELQFLYNTLEKAILKDDYELTCKHCELRRVFGFCKYRYCDSIKTRLRQLIEK